jgi:hypothetical protein
MRSPQLSERSTANDVETSITRVARTLAVACVGERRWVKSLTPWDVAQGFNGVAHLELYGGAGLGANAGGVRAANISTPLGTVQVKGTGTSILAGYTTAKWHKHGAMSLQDAIKEAVWSNVMDAALPYGAVKPIAVLDVGTRYATEIGVDKLPGSAPQALFVRETSVRVAHFMRSSFLNVAPEIMALELPKSQAFCTSAQDKH